MLRGLSDLLAALRPSITSAAEAEHAVQLAVSALLIEVGRSDAQFGPAETQAVLDALQSRFALQPDELAQLVNLATRRSIEAHDLYQFTSVVDRNFDDAQKLRIVEAAWRVAYADGRLCAHEDHLMRRLADLLHVPRAASMVAKLRAEAAAPGSATAAAPAAARRC